MAGITGMTVLRQVVGYGKGIVGRAAAEVGVSRRVSAIMIGAVLVLASGFAAGRIVASRSASQLVAEGRVTGTGGRPVSGIKVWLNAWPGPAAPRSGQQPGTVTVEGFAVTSATGQYKIRVSSPAALASDAADGVVTFSLMAGDNSAWDAPAFTRDLISTAGGFGPAGLAVPRGGSLTVNLHLTPGGP